MSATLSDSLTRFREWDIADKAARAVHDALAIDFSVMCKKLDDETKLKLWRACRQALVEMDGYQPFGWDRTILETHPGIYRLLMDLCGTSDNEGG